MCLHDAQGPHLHAAAPPASRPAGRRPQALKDIGRKLWILIKAPDFSALVKQNREQPPLRRLDRHYVRPVLQDPTSTTTLK